MQEGGTGHVSVMSDVPFLEGWTTLTEAAERLGVSKQAVHKMASEGKITTLRRIGRKPLYVMRDAELTRLEAAREEGRTAR